MDVGAGCSHKHAHCQAGVHILQVQLGGMRSAAQIIDITDYKHKSTDYWKLPNAHVHLGELEEGVDVDVAVKHVHGGSRQRNPETSKRQPPVNQQQSTKYSDVYYPLILQQQDIRVISQYQVNIVSSKYLKCSQYSFSHTQWMFTYFQCILAIPIQWYH